MNRKMMGIIMGCIFILSLTGCWNYRGLDELAIVAGLGIDWDQEQGLYQLTFEIVDLTVPMRDAGMQSMVVESQGKTLMEAIRNTKKRLINKLYFGNLQIVIVAQQVMEDGGIEEIIDLLLRDAEFRETMAILISQEKTAREILMVKGTDHDIISHQLQKILHEDQKITASTKVIPLYQIYNILNSKGESLVLPACRIIGNHDQRTAELNGIGIFGDRKLLGYLTPEETQFYLFAVDGIQGGILSFGESTGGRPAFSLEISHNRTEVSYSYSDNQINLLIEPKTAGYLSEAGVQIDSLDQEAIRRVEREAVQKLETEIAKVIKKIQAEYGSDVLGFGKKIYQDNPALWREVDADWNHIFQNIQVEIKPEVKILNTAYMKQNRGR